LLNAIGYDTTGANGAALDRAGSSSSVTSSVRQNQKVSDNNKRSPTKLSDVRIDGAEDANDEWLYDGDTERPSAWKPEQDDGNHLRVTRRGDRNRDQSPSPRHHLTPPRSPFELGEADDASDPEEDEPVKGSDRPLPSDAIDLIVDDQDAVMEAMEHERQKGEPNAHVIQHVYVPGDASSDSEGEESHLGKTPEDHKQDNLKAQRQVEENDIVREVEPPKVLAALQDIDDNPWM
jgi:hypothetical protein